MRGIIVLAATLCASGTVFAAEPVTPQPADWAVRPGLPVWRAAYPPEAVKNGVEGRVELTCHVSSAGWLRDCVVDREEPVGHGFGAAMIGVAQQNRLKPAFVRKHGADVKVPYLGGFGPADLLDSAPDWVKRPTASQLNAAWPVKAMQAGIGGLAIIGCKVTISGALEQCIVIQEKPADVGFGAAALLLAPAFQMKPAMKDGKPVASKVSVPISFNNPNGSVRSNPMPAIRVLTKPPFDRAPSYADVVGAWPAGGPESAADGKAAMRCRLRVTGLIDDCDFTFVSSPRFERPARELAKKFHVTVGPEITSKDISGVYVAVPIQFVSPARANPTRSVTHAVWVSGPVAGAYPTEADKQGIKSGRGTVACTVGANGGLTDCQVVSEAPEKLGFGPAAVEMASTMKMGVWGDDGLPTAGASVRLPLQINQPEPEPAAR